MEKTVTILVPMFNEEQVLSEFYSRIRMVIDSLESYRFAILFVDDGSTDRSVEIVKKISHTDPRVSLLALSRNFGKERALLSGIDIVQTDALIIIDADLQDPPELIPEMLKVWSTGVQDVYAQRRSRAGESWLKKTTASMYYRILQSVTNVDIQKDTGDFRLLDRVCVESLKNLRESERNTKALFSWVGYRKQAILYDRDPRAAGKTKFNYFRLTNLALDGITSFTTLPLRIATFLGLLVSFAAFVYLVIIVVKSVAFGSDVAGYPSLMAVMLFLGGVQLLCLGAVGEYVGRIFMETKQRPVYVVDEYQVGVPGPPPADESIRHED